jgi:hypothetical protein
MGESNVTYEGVNLAADENGRSVAETPTSYTGPRPRWIALFVLTQDAGDEMCLGGQLCQSLASTGEDG